MFEGSWHDKEGNISHEIIDFALTDNGDYYVYNIPYGCCPKWVHIKGDTLKDCETHEVEYLYLTSESRRGIFDLKYRIKLKHKLHSFSYHKTGKQKDIVSGEMEQLYEKRSITYGGKKISEILDTDTPLITFEADYMETAVEPISINFSEYNYQRNKGYLKEDEYRNDYVYFKEAVKKAKWIRTGLNPIVVNVENTNQYNKKTFLDLIIKAESEECYTNMLFSVLNQPGIFEAFCKTFASDRNIDYSHPFHVAREHGVVSGRMDIEPVCFLLVPDFRAFLSHSNRKSEIEFEIENNDPEMSGKYIVVSYGNVGNFIEKHKHLFNENYEYFRYLDDIIAAFRNYAYPSKSEYVQALFRQRIQELD